MADLPEYRSVEGRPIEVFSFGAGPRTVLLMAGVHGDESRGVAIVRSILGKLETLLGVSDSAPDTQHPTPNTIPSPPINHQPSTMNHLRVVVMPLVNPDGYAAGTRRNARGIDINRNLPTKDFDGSDDHPGGSEPASEPETRAVLEVVSRFDPYLIISLHESLACVNYNGELAIPVADRMSCICGLPTKGDIGYPCPGSMGTYYGWERQLPVITLELPKPEHTDPASIERAILDIIACQ